MSATDPTPNPAADRRALAEAATPGPWGAADGGSFGHWWISRHGDPAEPTIAACHQDRLADADFIAANDPQTVLADLDLIDAYRELHAASEHYHYDVFYGDDEWRHAERAWKAARARVAELEAQR